MKWLKRKRSVTTLGQWLEITVGRLCDEARERVETEIREHYEAAVEALVDAGCMLEESKRQAIAELGSPWAARRRLERIHLTKKEEKGLRRFEWLWHSRTLRIIAWCVLGMLVLGHAWEAAEDGWSNVIGQYDRTADFVFLGATIYWFSIAFLFPLTGRRLRKSSQWLLAQGMFAVFLALMFVPWLFEPRSVMKAFMFLMAAIVVTSFSGQARMYLKLRRIEREATDGQ